MSNFAYEDYVIIYGHKREDGLIFAENAFEKNDLKNVPITIDRDVFKGLDYNPCIGYAILENRDEGVYARCTFAGTELANAVKTILLASNILASSTVVNMIKQNGTTVLSGNIQSVIIIPRTKLLRYVLEEEK